MKKIEPAVQTMTFVIDADPSSGVAYRFVDLSQCASLLNRRFYRQGINWAVSSMKVLSTILQVLLLLLNYLRLG